jgi:hypothetical protein
MTFFADFIFFIHKYSQYFALTAEVHRPRRRNLNIGRIHSQKAWALLALFLAAIIWQSVANVAIALNSDFKRLQQCTIESDIIELISLKTGLRIEIPNPLSRHHHGQLCDFCLTPLEVTTAAKIAVIYPDQRPSTVRLDSGYSHFFTQSHYQKKPRGPPRKH